ncbi:TPA: P-loop ATPase, Sll1717 family [Vibrio cholerae]|uniref:P-loop ATPase, Sll1717 family n=1 Tax=Vibrio cholerae TaxID=666 RepID=UPI002FDBCAB9
MDIKEWFPEFQISAETDTDLQKYFFKLPEVKEITNSRSWLVLGRKGMGKTAIYEYLKTADSSNLNNFNTICVNFSDYPWPAHQLYKESLAGELSAYQKSWRYLFFVKALSRLIEIKERKKENINKELKWAKKYIEKIYGNPDPSLQEVIFSKIARLGSIRGPGFEIDDLSLDSGEVSFEDISENKQLQTKLRSNAYTLLSFFESIFKNNCGEHKILIALDQLDENWLDGEIDEYSKVLINLVNVCRNIALDPDLVGKLKVVPFLRTDIYHTLKFNDKNKLLQDSAIVISWDSNSLDDMYFERVKRYAPDSFSLDPDKKSGNLFEISFARQGTPPFNYITRRSFFRPRDIIVYFNKIRSCHKVNASGLYTSSELYNADREASASVYNELIDEWSNQFPEIENLLTVLQSIQVETFTYNDFSEKYKIEFPSSSDGDMRTHLTFLFDNSIIGQKKQGRWEYVCSTPNFKMNIEKDFRTHHALKYRLHLVESRPSQNI